MLPDRAETKPFAGGKMLAAKDDGVGLVTFNQPEKRNAMSMEMWTGLVISWTSSQRTAASAW